MSDGAITEFAEEIGILHVHVTNPQDIKPEKEAQCLTVVNTGTELLQAVEQPAHVLLPEDPDREWAIITALDNAVVICHTVAQANDAANSTNTLAQPTGSVIPINQPYPLTGQNKLWVTTGTFPSRVSVIVGRKGY